jgi:hypothetical protein
MTIQNHNLHIPGYEEKLNLQKRITKNGVLIPLDKFNYDPVTKTITTDQEGYVFNFHDLWKFTFQVKRYCWFITGSLCKFETGECNNFYTKSNCKFITGHGCNFRVTENCEITTPGLAFIESTTNCTINAGDFSTVSSSLGSIIKVGKESIIINRFYRKSLNVRKHGKKVQLTQDLKNWYKTL